MYGPRKDGRYGTLPSCRPCSAREQRRLRLLRRHRGVEGFLDKVRRARRIEHVLALTESLFRRFGGLEGIERAFDDWKAEVRAHDPAKWAKMLLAALRLAKLRNRLLTGEDES